VHTLGPGTVVASRYRVVRELGRGGMGAVHEVEHLGTGDHLALKILLGGSLAPEALERFKREARAPAKIQSENVVRVLDADTAPELGGAPFLVMELLRGSDLQKLVKERGPLQPAEVVRALEQVARVLDRSHALGVVHRDLKPENVFLHHRDDGSTVVKVLDFGISKVMSGGAMSGAQMTETGAIMGTPLYMSPEQARGAVHLVGPATDVWALGLVAFYLLSGEAYWSRVETPVGFVAPQSLSELVVLLMRAELSPPSRRAASIPPSFDAWMTRCCAADPAHRFPSAGDAVRALAEALRVPAAVGAAEPYGSTVLARTEAASYGPPSLLPAPAPAPPVLTAPSARTVETTPASRSLLL
jgi:serine/threonine-protein kinase